MDNDPDKVVMYAGKPIEDMTREELIEALNQMSKLYGCALDDCAKVIRLWSDCASRRQC